MILSPLRRLQRQASWLLVAFFVALAYITARQLSESYVERESARQVLAWARTSLQLNGVVHELQRERGLSSGLLSSGGRHFDVALATQRKQTDAVIARLRAHLAETRGEPLTDAARQLLGELETLPDLRRLITELKISRLAATDRYSQFVDSLFAPQIATVSIGHVGWIYRQQMAFLFFVQTKEMAGQERALVTAMLSTGDYGPISIMALNRIKAVEEARVEKFAQLSDSETLAGYRAIEAQAFVAEAKSVLRRIVAVGASNHAPHSAMPSASHWFDLATRKIDAMSDYEKTLGKRLLASAQQLERDAHGALWLNALLVLASVALASSLLLQISRGRDYAVKNLSLTQAVFDHSVEAIIITDAAADIVEVNQAFVKITGYPREEAIGRNPRLLSSGRQDRDFYAAMWRKIAADGSWQGEIWNRRKSGEIYPALLSIVAVRDERNAITNYIAMAIDLSKYKETETLLERLRTFDALTGLPNRDAWQSAVDQAVVNAQRNHGSFAVLDIGLDRFKLINESFGHPVGDQVLVVAAERIKQALRRHDIAARPGGDRFSVLLPDIDSPRTAGSFCERILAAFVPPIETQGNVLPVSVSIGVALHPADGTDRRTLLKNAEAALNKAKVDSRAGYVFYTEEMNAAGAQLLALERLLREALVKGEFTLAYQPQITAAGRRLVGVEALLRWRNAELGNVSPVQFIPVAEATGLVVPIGEWVLHEACRQASQWRHKFGTDITMAVNLSARQFHKENLLATVQLALDAHNLPARLLELEITEGLLLNDPANATVILEGLRWMGIKIAIDDFGTGYSSLAYLKNFPLDRLKLDQAFVRELPNSGKDMAIARAIIDLARHLGLQTLAEGIETPAQAEFLSAAGCDVFQGYLFGRPQSPDELESRIAAGELTLV